MSGFISQDKNVRVDSICISELFKLNLVIPEYQRPYLWKADDLDKLLHQIQLYVNNKAPESPMFYLGSIVLHEDAKKNLNIIDGQQRITTLAIIALIKDGLNLGITYENLISIQNIKSNYDYLSKQQCISLVNLDEINVTIVVTQNQDDAYNFFETLNTGGMRLSGIDIIKAHHLRSLNPLYTDEFAILWEKEQTHIENVVKLLLKARKWNYLLDFPSIPSRRSSLQDWKKIISDEFTNRTLKDKSDIAYSQWKMSDNTMERVGNNYHIRQPVSDGKNFISYLLSYITIYKQLFVLSNDSFYRRFNEEIINKIDGTVDLKALYQLALLCYASRFGINNLTEASLWVFRFVYSLRVKVENRVQEATVFNHNRGNKLIDNILMLNSEREILDWLKAYSYEISQAKMEGVKGRYVNRVNLFFNLGINLSDIAEFDEKLKVKIQAIEIL